ncbi:arginase [Paenibacillus sp. J5C_2022]|nr:arginase [Paenibacillus sp. J5C2022]MCU6710589.1 arginase [Paenibacillus sp. J5C2022]
MSGKRVACIQVPFGRGGSMGGAELGPDALLQAGLLNKLERLGYRLESHVVDVEDGDSADGDDSDSSERGGSGDDGDSGEGEDGGDGIDYRVDEDGIDGIEDIDDRVDGDGVVQMESAAGMKHFGEVRDMAGQVAAAVASAVRDGAFPLVLGGDHSVSIGSLAGLLRQRRKLGVIWIDAHGDCNTEMTSPSGNAHGMVLAVAAGLSKYKLTDMPGVSCGIQPSRIVLLGARELDEGEKAMIAAHGIHCLTVDDIDRMGIHTAAEQALALAGDGTDAIHLSLDMDALDPLEAPAVGTPVPGGLTFREVRGALERLGESGRIQSMDIVEVNPLAASQERTALLATELAATLLGKRLGIGGGGRL